MKKPAKTAAKTAVARIPQPHGGSLLAGGVPGNRGGVGAVPSVLRERLRGSFARRVAVIEEIADGTPTRHASLRIADVVPHIVCANCGESEIKAASPESLFIEITATVSASPKDRLDALDLAAKYGLGTLKEVSVENVRERVTSTLDVIRAHCSPAQAATIIAALRPVWS